MCTFATRYHFEEAQNFRYRRESQGSSEKKLLTNTVQNANIIINIAFIESINYLAIFRQRPWTMKVGRGERKNGSIKTVQMNGLVFESESVWEIVEIRNNNT